MCQTDMVVVTDKGFKPYAKKYAQDEAAFFSDFSKAFGKLIELGVPEEQVRFWNDCGKNGEAFC
jgi:cytochrome c peroxidase